MYQLAKYEVMRKIEYNFDEKKLLDLFIDNENIFHPEYNNPYRNDGYVYATNTRKMIRIKENAVRGDYKTAEIALNIAKNNCNYTITAENIEKVLSAIPQIEEIMSVGNNIKCSECDGEGTVTWKYTDKNWNDYEIEEDCPVCEGVGYIEKERQIKTGRIIPNPNTVVKVGKNNIMATNLQVLLDAMRIIGVMEVRLVCQKGVINHFRIDRNISVLLASNKYSAECELKLKKGGKT